MKTKNLLNKKITQMLLLTSMVLIPINAFGWIGIQCTMSSDYYQGDKYVGDKLSSSEWWYNFKINYNDNWNETTVCVGPSDSNYSSFSASKYQAAPGGGSDCHADIQSVVFKSSGNWFVWAKAKANSSDPYSYTNKKNYNENMTTLYLYTDCQLYWNVKAITAPTKQKATAAGTTQINLSWTQNSTHKQVMVVRSTSSTAPTPTGGTSYSVGSTVGTGYTVIFNSSTGTSKSDTGLSASTKYYYYFFSVNNNYYSSSVTDNATTETPCTDPKVNSQTTAAASYCKNASSVTPLSVSASGTNATYKWQQSTTGTSDWSDVSTGTGYTTDTFTPSVASSGTLYYKCIVSACNTTAESAVSGAIKVYGNPTATTGTTVSNITNTTATVSGSSCATGTPASTITEYGIEINSTKYNKTSGDESSFAVALTGLSANTTYTYKAYVTDGCTTKYGDEKSFTTAPGSIYVRGPIMGDNGDGAADKCWDNASYYEMQNNGSNVFTKTFNPSGNYCDYGPKEFVLTMENNDYHKLNPDWFDSKTGCQKSSRQGQGDNFESTLKYSNADQLTLTVTWNGNNDYSISLVKTNNQPTDLYIKGPLVDGNWDGGYKQPGYTKNGDTYVFTFEARTGGDAREFCISSTQGDKGKIHYTTTKGTYAGWDFKDTQEGKNFVASDQIVTRDKFPIKVTVTYVGDADYDFTLDIESNGCEKPTLSLTMPYSSGKTYNKITANAQITNTGTCTINEFGVEAFSNADCTQRVSYTTGSTSSTSEQSLEVTGLTANTKYWFRAYAKTDDGDTYSSVVTDFTRVNAEKMSATNITSSSATLQGKALVDGGFATELESNALFKYGTTNVVADATSVTSSSKAIGSVIIYDLSGLAAGTTYYYWFCPTTTDGSHPTTPNYPMNSFTTNRVHSDIVLDNQSVCVGANITLEPTCSTATNGFTYESKNTSVATVDASGKVQGVAAGTATITVTTKAVSGYDVKTKDITVTVNANAFTIVVSPDSPLAYQVVTLSASNGESTTWTKASSDAYFVGADGLVINGDVATAESIKLKAKSGATSTVYTISATQSDGTCAYNTREITVSADTENCSGN